MTALQDCFPGSELQAAVQADRAADYFETAHQAFLRAASAAGGFVDHHFRLVGHRLCLRFAGRALVPYLTPALAHLGCEPNSAPELTACLWDSVSTGTTMPPPAWQPADHGPRGEIRGFNDARIQTAFQHGPNSLSMLDHDQGRALYWVRDSSQLPYYESGAPLRNILHWWLNRLGCQLFHGAAVGKPAGGVLLGGKGGSGKSTTALACLNSELSYAGDDYVVVDDQPKPFVWSLYNSAKLNADHVHRLPFLVPRIHNRDSLASEKALLFLQRWFPEKLIPGFPIRALLLPRVTGLVETALRPLSPTACLAALAPSTIFQLPGAGHGAFQTVARLVQRVPSYVLELGTDLARIPGVISELS